MQIHRITESFGLGGISVSFQPPSNVQGCHSLDQVAQDPIQPSTEYFTGGGSEAVPRQSSEELITSLHLDTELLTPPLWLHPSSQFLLAEGTFHQIHLSQIWR